VRWLIAIRGEGHDQEAEQVLVDVENGRVIFGLDDGDTLSFDLDELRAELSIAEGADDATRVLGRTG
jgi:hypothetical protein